MCLNSAKTGNVNLNVVRWFDNKVVTLLSTYAAIEPVKQVNCFDKKNKVQTLVKSPDIVTKYNKFMGYVDQLDMLVALYRINMRSKKWYHRIIFHFLDVILINSWCLYRAAHVSIGTQKKCIMPLLDFKLEVAQCLLSQNKAHDAKKRGRPSLDSVESEFDATRKRGPAAPLPPTSVRTDGMKHWRMPVS